MKKPSSKKPKADAAAERKAAALAKALAEATAMSVAKAAAEAKAVHEEAKAAAEATAKSEAKAAAEAEAAAEAQAAAETMDFWGLDAKDFSDGEDVATAVVLDAIHKDFSDDEDVATGTVFVATDEDVATAKARGKGYYSVWDDLISSMDDAGSTSDVHSSPEFWEETFSEVPVVN